MKRIAKWICWLAAFVVSVTCQVFADELSPEAFTNFIRQIEIQENAKSSLSVESLKLQGELLDIAQCKNQARRTLASTSQGSSDVRKECQIACSVSDRLVELIVAAGGEVTCKSERDNTIIAMLPTTALSVIAEDEDVWKIYPIKKAKTNGNVSEGFTAHRANMVKSSYGITGKDVRVGVISDSADTYKSGDEYYTGLVKKLQNSGDLPSDVTIVGDAYGSGEGSGMMEIVYDLAPDAKLYFKNAVNSDVEFARCIESLMNVGCNVIVDDVTVHREAAFEAGPIGRKIKEFVDKGGIYFSSAANSGAFDRGTSCTWEGDYREGNSVDGLGGTYHDFGNGNANQITALPLCDNNGNMSLYARLWWSDPWGKSSNDYNLYLVDQDGNIQASSTDTQDGKGYPFECIDGTITQTNFSKVKLYLLVVKKAGAKERFLRLEVYRGGLKFATCGSTFGHNAGEDVISCAAASASGFTRAFKSSDSLENFSSDGPRRIFYTVDGTEITSGNLLSSGGRLLQKPDFTAADNTLSAWTATAFGLKAFGGTSAAAPHAAAIAALMLEANPNLTQSDIVAIFKKSTFSGANATWNRNYGYGILDAYTAVKLAKESVATKIGITPPTQDFTSSKGDGTITVTASSTWTATTSDSWITLNTKSGNGNGTISYSVSSNDGVSGRSGSITVTCGSDKAIHNIRQAAASAQLNISPAMADYSDVAENGQISVTANYAWAATTSAAWITLHTDAGNGNGTVLYSVDANTGSQRTGTITVTSGTLTATHTVTQAAQPSLSLDPSSKTFSAASGKCSIAVTSDSMWTVSKSATWITLENNKTSGNGNDIVTYTVSENTGAQRQGWIYFTCGSVQRTHLVTQNRAEEITFSEESATISSDGGTGTFTVTILGNNRVVSVTASTVKWASWTWAHENITEGIRYTFTYTIQANTTGQMRSTTVPIDFNGTVYNFTITQNPQISNYLVTYRPGTNGSGSEAYDVKQKNVSLTLRGAIFTRTGYTQKGWATSDGGAKVYDLGASYTKDASVTLYPYWETGTSGSTTYTLRFSPGPYGTGNEQTATKYKGVSFTLPGALYTRDGYDQTGWSVFSSGTSKTYELGGSYGNDAAQTFYPYWTEKEEEQTSFDIGFFAPSGWKSPVCLSTTNLAAGAYAPQYVFGQDDGLVLNYCVGNFGDTAVTFDDRYMSLWDVNDKLVCSELESASRTISYNSYMRFRNRDLSGWLASLAPGNYVLEVSLDPYGKLNDTNDANNWRDEWFAVKADGITLNEALDCSSLYFTDNGTTAFPQTSECVVGGSCVQLGPQPTNAWNSTLWVYLTEPGTLKFKWKATSQNYKAYLGCFVDSELKAYKWATEQSEWEEASVTIDSAPQWVHLQLVSYEPDPYYLTAGWVDCVTWSGDAKKPTFTVDSKGTLTGVQLNGATALEIPSMVNSVAVRAIGAYVLTNTPITSISIPNTVTNIARFAFYDNRNLSGVTIPGSVVAIGESAFNACSSLKSVVLGEGVESIGNYAFYNCGSLSVVTLPASATSIGQSPFGNCGNLQTISVASGNFRYFVENNALIDIATRTLVQYPSGRQESEYDVPDGLLGIGYDAFDTVTCLTKVTVPASVTSLGSFAFFQCSGLTTIVFKGNAPSVGYAGFYGVAASCKAVVSPQSTGWGVEIPGTWAPADYCKVGIEYSAALQTYSVTYKPGANGVGVSRSDVKSYGVALPLECAIFKRTGYLQTGWATSDGGAKAYELGASYTMDAAVTLYPYWTANTYAVAYDLDGGTAGATRPGSATYDMAFCVSAPQKDGYVFAGWMVTSGLDITTAKYGESASNPSTGIDNASMQCFNGSDVDVWFINLTASPDGAIVLTATWEETVDDSRDIGFYAPESKGWTFPVCLSSTNIDYLAYAPETQFGQFSNVFLSFCAVNWNRSGTAILQSTLLTITDENGDVFDQGEPIQRYTFGAFGYQEFRNLSLRRYMSGITPGRYKLTLELDPNRMLSDPDRANNTTSIWFTVCAPSEAIPELPSDATAADVRAALAGSADGKLSENISDATTYSAYREWAQGVKDTDGNVAGVAAVKTSDKAWFSFAIDSPKLIERQIAGDDVKIENFSLSSDCGQFDFIVGIEDVEIGDAAAVERLKTVFGVEGAAVLDDSAFSSDNLTLEAAEPEDGKVKLTAKPAPVKTDGDSDDAPFFMRVKVTP